MCSLRVVDWSHAGLGDKQHAIGTLLGLARTYNCVSLVIPSPRWSLFERFNNGLVLPVSTRWTKYFDMPGEVRTVSHSPQAHVPPNVIKGEQLEKKHLDTAAAINGTCLLYTSPSPRDS